MKTHVIIGAAAAGISALNTLTKLDPNSRIICISDEPENPYNKCFLADYLHKVKQEDELNILRQDVFAKPNVNLFLAARVTNINPESKTISLSDGSDVPYDTLFIGTGSSPVIPPITGISNGEGVFTFHTLADANKIMAYAKDHGVRSVAVVGAGLSGLECADSLRSWGLDVTVIERGERVLARQVDEQGSVFIATMMERASIELLCNETVSEIMHEGGRVSGVRLVPHKDLDSCVGEINIPRSSRSLEGYGESNRYVPQGFPSIQIGTGGTNGKEQNVRYVRPVKMLIIATGLKPNVELARSAGLELRDGYIAVNDRMQCSDPSIFAGGDCVMVLDQLTKQYVPSCTWPDAMQQGSVAAHAMADIEKKYLGAIVVTSSAFFGVTFVTCGMVMNIPEDYMVRVTRGDDFYHKIVLLDGVVKGYLLIGNTQQASKLRRAIMTGESWT